MPAPPFDDLTIGSLSFHIYGLLLGLAIIAGIMVVERTIEWVGFDRSVVMPIALPAVAGGFIGARLNHVLTEPTRYGNNPGDILLVWNGGLGIWGAVIGGAATAAFFAHRKGIPVLVFFDAAIPGVAIAQAIGRWGNYFNQELFGRATDLPWALTVDGLEGTYHPTFLYESLWNFGNFLLLIFLLRRWKPRPAGAIFAIYFMVYSVGRMVMETLRIDETNVLLGLRQNTWIAMIIFWVAAGALMYIMIRFRARQAARAEGRDPNEASA